MRRFTFRFAVALLTFVIGVAAASLWLITRQPPKAISVAITPPAPPQIEKNRTYEPGIHAEGLSSGRPACFATVGSSDGINFSWTRISYNSPKGATKAMSKILKQAVEIIKREPLVDESGKKVGEEVVATFAPYEGGSAVSARLLWTNGIDFGYVEGPSLENILAYEEDHER